MRIRHLQKYKQAFKDGKLALYANPEGDDKEAVQEALSKWFPEKEENRSILLRHWCYVQGDAEYYHIVKTETSDSPKGYNHKRTVTLEVVGTNIRPQMDMISVHSINSDLTPLMDLYKGEKRRKRHAAFLKPLTIEETEVRDELSLADLLEKIDEFTGKGR